MGHDMGQWDMGVNINIGQWSKFQVFIYKIHFTENLFDVEV